MHVAVFAKLPVKSQFYHILPFPFVSQKAETVQIHQPRWRPGVPDKLLSPAPHSPSTQGPRSPAASRAWRAPSRVLPAPSPSWWRGSRPRAPGHGDRRGGRKGGWRWHHWPAFSILLWDRGAPWVQRGDPRHPGRGWRCQCPGWLCPLHTILRAE